MITVAGLALLSTSDAHCFYSSSAAVAAAAVAAAVAAAIEGCRSYNSAQQVRSLRYRDDGCVVNVDAARGELRTVGTPSHLPIQTLHKLLRHSWLSGCDCHETGCLLPMLLLLCVVVA
jgi:hypothetical protein